MRLILAFVLLLLAPAAMAADRVALVLGNGAYSGAATLPNATNDARDMAERLRGMGFSVYEGIDLSRIDMLRIVAAFTEALAPASTALFYFAGHGAQIGGENYLLPVDAEAGDEFALTADSVKLQSILRAMELRADTRIVILDACRNNPFLQSAASRSSGAATRGLSRVEAGVGSYIAFSTQPGNVALDGGGRNSPFTAALLRHIDAPRKDIHAIMRDVRADVVNASNGTQIPWENSSLIDALFLAPAAPQPERAGRPLSSVGVAPPGASPGPAPVPAPAPSAPTPSAPPPAGPVLGAPPPPPPPAAPAGPLPRAASPSERCLALDGGLRLCASSVLAAQAGNSYGPANLLDGDGATAWVEGVQGDGIGAYLAVDLAAPASVSALDIVNGYAKSAALHRNNGRVRELLVTASNGASQRLSLADSMAWQSFALRGFSGITWLRLEIAGAVSGARWADTAISELRLR